MNRIHRAIGASVAWGVAVGITVLAAAGTIAWQQQPALPEPDTSGTAPMKMALPVSMAGCVQADRIDGRQFTVTDRRHGVVYKLLGTGLKGYVGERVRIVGGLVPSTNIAAQLGNIDASIVARAWLGGTDENRGFRPMTKTSVSRIDRLPGPCPSP